jgi:hypothetical protein
MRLGPIWARHTQTMIDRMTSTAAVGNAAALISTFGPSGIALDEKGRPTGADAAMACSSNGCLSVMLNGTPRQFVFAFGGDHQRGN